MDGQKVYATFAETASQNGEELGIKVSDKHTNTNPQTDALAIFLTIVVQFLRTF